MARNNPDLDFVIGHINNEIPKHKKKAKHNTPKKADHKHKKVECIVEEHRIIQNTPSVWMMLGWHCPICNKVRSEVFEWGVNLKEKYPNLEMKVVDVNENM